MCFPKSQQNIKAPLSNESILRLMYKLEGTEIRMFVFIPEDFFKEAPIFYHIFTRNLFGIISEL